MDVLFLVFSVLAFWIIIGSLYIRFIIYPFRLLKPFRLSKMFLISVIISTSLFLLNFFRLTYLLSRISGGYGQDWVGLGLGIELLVSTPLLIPLILLANLAGKMARDTKESSKVRSTSLLIKRVATKFIIFILIMLIITPYLVGFYESLAKYKSLFSSNKQSTPIERFDDTTGYKYVGEMLWMKIESFKIEEGGAAKIRVDTILKGSFEKDIDLSYIHMDFTPPGGKPVSNAPIPTVTKYHMKPPQKLTMDLEYNAIGKGPNYTFNYNNFGSTVSLGTFR
ncbi:MAG: hypothetical protein COX79_04525 [Candidatus Levybacteria bacterium CG_4_10_14_0_2_um_filter_36_16]|nr:MAG: hypothetical protein AUK12_03080 [Candidatus Levybacteria bacterium CG2_30_37_29]PIR79459.1 MAG: hypothetical protein COU26_01010 [Candidatus Levybacteria bacterium CG10_big_fil_rev_8_21_14_0_10_36_30]PIZ96700.1 MAG: hypothetical protein COX79_04525 [Candidatus Levybacteria bacterium CG_4_10_14_0_2_um_filter_36_16]